jgi:hypothetical protein
MTKRYRSESKQRRRFDTAIEYDTVALTVTDNNADRKPGGLIR